MRASEDFLNSIARGGRLAPLTLALGLCSGLLPAQSKLPPSQARPRFQPALAGKPTDIGQTSPAGLRRVVTVLGGTRHGPPELIAKLNAGESVDQSKIYFRTIITIETAAKTLDWMSRSILVSVGERQPSEAVIHVYRLN